MREILFRGKRKDNGEWVEGYFVNCFDEFYRENGPFPEIIMTDAERICAGEYTYDKAVEVIPETVGQWSGLLDKNGKKIFEGDVVKTKYGRLCTVIWFSSPLENCWDLEIVNTVENLSTMCPDAGDLFEQRNLEVIGNIHDNPELLKSST